MLSKLWKSSAWLFKTFSGISVLILAALMSGQQGPIHQVARVLGAVADLGEATSIAAVNAINATNHMASAASTLVVSAASNGLSAGANLWHGVDFTNVRAKRCGGMVVTADVVVLQAWLDTPEAAVHFPCINQVLKDRLLAAGTSIAEGLPFTQSITEDLNLTGSFLSLRTSASLVTMNRLQVQFEAVSLLFDLSWANPLWNSWGFDVGLEREQVLASLRNLLLDLPSTSPQRAYKHIDLEVSLPELSMPSQVRYGCYRFLSTQLLWLSGFLRGLGRVDAMWLHMLSESFWTTPHFLASLVLIFSTILVAKYCPPVVSLGARQSCGKLVLRAILDGSVGDSVAVNPAVKQEVVDLLSSPGIETIDLSSPVNSPAPSECSFCLISRAVSVKSLGAEVVDG